MAFRKTVTEFYIKHDWGITECLATHDRGAGALNESGIDCHSACKHFLTFQAEASWEQMQKGTIYISLTEDMARTGRVHFHMISDHPGI